VPAPVRFARLEDWLEWQQSAHPQAIDLGLGRVARVLARTGWHRPERPVITVGGTNGKGSCVAMVESVLRASGCRVATFTSPHLVDYRERIRLDGRCASEASLVAAFERIADACAGDTLTFFEFNALAALLVFESWAPDVTLLEVGMGGRLDAVNVVDADVAVVVSVGLDHVEWLGPDLTSIAREKAGIFRPDRPAISGMANPPSALIEAATACGADLRLRGRDFGAREHEDGSWDFADAGGRLERLPPPALAGVVQVGNAATALATLRSLSPRLVVERGAIERGLREVHLPGRFQRVPSRRGFEWVLDVGHNPDAAAVLAANLARWPVSGRTMAVCGMLADKDVAGVLVALRDRVDRWFAAATEGPRGLGDAALAAQAAAAGIRMTEAGSIAQAMAKAASEAREGDRVVVFGSFHTVGPALSCV
jgi:dihydrofolate synthase / folylpolyglutamate synthase